jgi:hypothetical protein
LYLTLLLFAKEFMNYILNISDVFRLFHNAILQIFTKNEVFSIEIK